MYLRAVCAKGNVFSLKAFHTCPFVGRDKFPTNSIMAMPRLNMSAFEETASEWERSSGAKYFASPSCGNLFLSCKNIS